MVLVSIVGGSNELLDVQPDRNRVNQRRSETLPAAKNMAAPTGLSAPALGRCDVPGFRAVALSAEAAPFTPMAADGWQHSPPSDAEKLFSRCAAKVRALRGDSGQLKEDLNLLFDQLLSENYNKNIDPNINIRPEVTDTYFPTLAVQS